LKGVKRLEPNLELHVVGEGFVGILDDNKELKVHQEAARKGLALAQEKIESGLFQLVILDELNVALKLGLIGKEEVQELLATCSVDQHLVITGRDAPDWLIDRADLVTSMTEVKHPFREGIQAQKGIDW
jgi:cob(I)alamin adenosyltransferase